MAVWTWEGQTGSLSSSLTVYCAWCPLDAADKCWNDLMEYFSRPLSPTPRNQHTGVMVQSLPWWGRRNRAWCFKAWSAPLTPHFLLLVLIDPDAATGPTRFSWLAHALWMAFLQQPPSTLAFLLSPFFPCLWGCRQWNVGCTLSGCLPSRLNTLLHPRFEHYLQDEKLTMLTHWVK